MASDQLVGPRAVLRALALVKRRGNKRVLEELEQAEPELASCLMEELSQIHRKLLNTGASNHEVRRLHRQIESLVLMCVTAVRTGSIKKRRSRKRRRK
jgi:hypothetical protein